MEEWGIIGKVLDRSPHAHPVREAARQAAGLLPAIRDTFPAYTLHDERHALNVVHLMGKLAAPRIDKLEPLEAALLILSAYFHDIGMVYSEQDRAAIPDEEEYQAFLQRDADAFLAVHRNDGVPPSHVLERYCRLRHADRALVHLNRIEAERPDLLEWDGISLTSTLHLLCRSHNDHASTLLTPEFDPFFEADTRFCAMLLRLADIMDFGRSRAPQILYDYLGLSRRSDAAAAESAEHWEKQIAGRGFLFPNEPPESWPAIYPLGYAANPRDPNVEHAIRRSLDQVRTELQLCRPVRDQCPRWRDLPLPGDVDTRRVEGKGYTYGEFRFELDRPAVLELFTGEQLYEDRFAFLRELLQNAIDTVEARRRIHGAVEGNPDAIAITCWQDDDGFVWVRIDDSGMGMDERLLLEYFLRVGRSYYTSAEFEAQMLHNDQLKRFTPISRFGIGVLSCFMVGDRVEVATRHLVRGGAAPERGTSLRLSLRRDRDFFVLRRTGQGPDDMPADHQAGRGFRRHTGTSIAIRVDPDRTGITVEELVAKADGYLVHPPVPVTINGERAGMRRGAALLDPWFDDVVTTTVDLGDRPATGALPVLGEVTITAVPIDLNATTDRTSVGGQLIALTVTPASASDPVLSHDLLAGWPSVSPEIAEALSTAALEPSLRVGVDMNYSDDYSDMQPSVSVSINRSIEHEKVGEAIRGLEWSKDEAIRPPEAGETNAQKAAILASSPATLRHALWQVTEAPPGIRSSWHASVDFSLDELGLAIIEDRLRKRTGIDWSHNGIGVPSEGMSTGVALLFSRVSMHGAVSLSGTLRPDLTISRTSIRTVPFPVHSAVQLAVRLAVDDTSVPADIGDRIKATELIDVGPGEHSSVMLFRCDPLVAGGAWNAERVIPLSGSRASVEEILASVARDGEVHFDEEVLNVWGSSFSRSFSFYRELPACLLHLFVPLEYRPDDGPSGHGLYAVQRPHQVEPPSDLLPPLHSVPFEGSIGLARSGYFLNARHPLARWISANATALARDFPASFNQVFRSLHWPSAEKLNAALDRVRRADSDIPPPPEEAYVRMDDRMQWWSR